MGPGALEVRDFLQDYSALVFDGTGVGLRPAMCPRIYDEYGALLVDTKACAAWALRERGVGKDGDVGIRFTANLCAASSTQNQGGQMAADFMRDVLVVDIIGVRGEAETDIVVGSSGAPGILNSRDGLCCLISNGRLLIDVLPRQ